LKTNLAYFYFKNLCIKLVALRMNLYQEVALSFKKVGDPWSIERNPFPAKNHILRFSRAYISPTK